MKDVRITITGTVPKKRDFEELKRLESHVEFSGITKNYPELENIHVEVEEVTPENQIKYQQEILLLIDQRYIATEKSKREVLSKIHEVELALKYGKDRVSYNRYIELQQEYSNLQDQLNALSSEIAIILEIRMFYLGTSIINEEE